MNTNKKRKVNGIVVIVFICIIAALIVVVNLTDTPKAEKVGALGETLGLTAEEEKERLEIFEKIEAGRIKKVERHQSKDKEYKLAYAVNVDSGDNLLMYVIDKKIISVMLDGHLLYADGEYKAKLTDYVITIQAAAEYKIKSEELIKKLLKSPTSAKFPSITNWKIGKMNGETVIQSYVDADNSFGANLRSEFQIIINKNNEVKSLIFDGTEYIK